MVDVVLSKKLDDLLLVLLRQRLSLQATKVLDEGTTVVQELLRLQVRRHEVGESPTGHILHVNVDAKRIIVTQVDSPYFLSRLIASALERSQ